MKTYFVDGQFLSPSDAKIPVDDLSVLRGFGVCDVMRTYDKKPYLMQAHIRRLVSSAADIGLKLPWDETELSHIILKTLEKNLFQDEANIRTIITGGSSPDFFTPSGPPRLIVMVTDLKPLPASYFEKGIKVITCRQERSMPGTKVTAYIPAALALKKAKQKGCIEALYINREDHVLEGTTSNLFLIKGEKLFTPAKEILKGITRQAIIELADKICPVSEKTIRLNELLSADEIFISGTSKGVVPVVQVDNTSIGSGFPGPVTKKIMAALMQHSTHHTSKNETG